MSLHQLDTLDDVLDLVMELPKEDIRGIDMRTVKSLQQMIYYKQMDRKKNYEALSVPI
tara:strand:- start:6 stop:179 length:174 start_codon:yes stop_codon:yes gene_type:complete